MKLQQQKYTKKDVLQAIPGLGADKLHAWLTRGLIPLDEYPTGSGRPRLWSATDVVYLAAYWELTRIGVAIGFAPKLIAAQIREHVVDAVNNSEDSGKGTIFVVFSSEDDPEDLCFAGLNEQSVELLELDEIIGPKSVATIIRADLLIFQVLERLMVIDQERLKAAAGASSHEA